MEGNQCSLTQLHRYDSLRGMHNDCLQGVREIDLQVVVAHEVLQPDLCNLP